MPATPTGNTTVASGQIVSTFDMLVSPFGSAFGGPDDPDNLVRTLTRVPTGNLRSILFHVYHFPIYATGTATVPGINIVARLNCSWRPVFIGAPTTRQDVSGANSPSPAVTPAGTVALTYEPFNAWTPLVPPQLCAPGVPSFITLEAGGAILVGVELSVPLAPFPQVDRFRITVSAAE